MIFKKIKGYENYHIYENGDVYNIATNIKLKIINNRDISVKLENNGIKKNVSLKKIIYENFNEEPINSGDIIKFKDNNKLNFHYKNIIKINRKEMFKVNKDKEFKLDNTKEWKIIKDYPDYKISNYGDIFSIKTNKLLKLRLDYHKYYSIKLNNGIKKEFKVHRLVYDAFKGLTDSNKVIDHIDRNPSNNYIDNLREVTKSENSYNREFTKMTCNKIYQYSLIGELVKVWDSNEEIRKDSAFKSSNISDCCLGKIDSACGFIWKNEAILNNTDDFVEIKSNCGQKYSMYKINKKGQIINKYNKLMKYAIKNGYYTLELTSNDKIEKTLKVHRLVASTFLSNPNNYPFVNHIDENKLNNDIKNLEWCTNQQNIIHSLGKKVNQINIKTNEIIKTFDCIQDAYRKLGKIYNPNIRWVCTGKRNMAYGYKWSYA
jgi:hypothetical protein